MTKVSLKLGDKTLNLKKATDLLKLADPSQDSIVFQIAETALEASQDKSLREIQDTELTAELGVEHDAKWKLGDNANLTFGFDASAKGSVTIRKEGELLRYRLGQDEKNEAVIKVPAGHAYVSVEMVVSLGVEGGLAYSHGAFGVSADGSKGVKFVIANHKCMPLETTVGTALTEALEKFRLPFKSEGVESLGDGDYLEYEFIGKLALGFGLTYGVSGLFFGGRSNGEIMRSFESPIGKAVVKAKPSFKAQASFSVGYEHEDAFRIVVGRQLKPESGTNTVTLFVFRMDASKLSVQFQAGISVSAGASAKFDLELDKVIDEAAKKLVEGLADGPVKDAAILAFKEGLKRVPNRKELEKYVKEANARVNKLLKKLDNQKIELTVLHERIKRDTALHNYEFDLDKEDALVKGYPLAVAGNFLEAIQVEGVNLLPGSFVESEVIRRTSISLQLFDLFRFVSITEYFRKAAIVYAGQGVFRLRFVTGVKHESGQVGHTGQVEVFFTAEVLTKDFESVNDLDVQMHFVLLDNKKRKAARQTVRALERIGAGSDLELFAPRLSEAVENTPSLQVKVSCVFDREAYGQLQSDDFEDGKPRPLPHVEDERNWDAFVGAVNFIHDAAGYKGEGFPDLVELFDNWVLYNRTAIDREESTKPPNRMRRGNTNVQSAWPSRWISIGESDRRFLFIYLDAGRRFLNLCDGLKHLAMDVDNVETDEQYRQVLKDLNEMIKEDVKVWFTKSILVALFKRTGSRVVDVQGPEEGEAIEDTFELSFRAEA